MSDDALTDEQRAALVRHGYDPDIPPCGISGPPSRFYNRISDEWLRPWVCQLDGIEIDGHQVSDLFPEDRICMNCDRDPWEFDDWA